MDFKKNNFFKSCTVTFFITFSVFANTNDPVDRDWYHYGQSINDRPDRVVDVYPMYPYSGNREDHYSVRVVEPKNHPALDYYNDNVNPASFGLVRKAENLERIKASAFAEQNAYPVSLRDILDLTHLNRFRSVGQGKYSQLPEIDLARMDDYFSRIDLQRAAYTLHRQMQDISNKFAKIIYDSLVKNNTDGGKGAANFVRYVLGEQIAAEYLKLPNPNEKWTGADPLSILVKEKFMTMYPRVLKSSDVRGYRGPFISYTQILFEQSYVSKKQANELINKFELLAESLVNEKDNLAAHLVGKSIKDDFRKYGLAEYKTYRRSLSACGRWYTK